MSGAFCPWCGTRHCDRCRRPPYEAPRHCAQCGRRLRVTVHPTGFEARCRGCPTVTGSVGIPGTAPPPEGAPRRGRGARAATVETPEAVPLPERG